MAKNFGTAALIPITNPIERLNGEIKRRAEVVGIVPNEAAITRLVGAILMEQGDEWAVQRARYMILETMRRSATIPSSCSRQYPEHDWLKLTPENARSNPSYTHDPDVHRMARGER